MTKTELSLLLFFESRYVNYAGRVNTDHMNDEDFAIARRWSARSYIEFGRICSADIDADGAYYVLMSDDAVADAHKERIARIARMQAKRTWRSTKEYRRE